MYTMEEMIDGHLSAIIALTDDQSRDVVPIMADIRREAERARRQLNEGDQPSVDLVGDIAAALNQGCDSFNLTRFDEGTANTVACMVAAAVCKPSLIELMLVDGDGNRLPATVYDVDTIGEGAKLRINAETNAATGIAPSPKDLEDVIDRLRGRAQQ